jgi:hypothetical protein
MDQISHKNWLETPELPTPSRWAIAFGAVLPLTVLMLEPFILHPDNGLPFGPVSVLFGPTALYVSALTTVLIFLTWHKPASTAQARALRAGWLMFGVIVSFSVGCVILVPSTIGLVFMFIGALGYSPFVVAYVHYRNFRDYPNRRALPLKWLALGAGLHAALALGLYMAERQFFNRLVANLNASASIQARMTALHDIALYPFAFSRFDHLVCGRSLAFEQDSLLGPDFERAFNAALAERYGERTEEMRTAMSKALRNPDVARACLRVAERNLD